MAVTVSAVAAKRARALVRPCAPSTLPMGVPRGQTGRSPCSGFTISAGRLPQGCALVPATAGTRGTDPERGPGCIRGVAAGA